MRVRELVFRERTSTSVSVGGNTEDTRSTALRDVPIL